MTDSKRMAHHFVFFDTSALLALTLAEMHYDTCFRTGTEADLQVASLEEILDRVTDHGRRTLVITREVLIELFPTNAGRLDVVNTQGKLSFPLGHHHSEFTYAHSTILYQLFSQYAQRGQMRFYSSPGDMFAAGEADTPQGGMVVVDNGLRREPPNEHGEIRSPNRDNFQGARELHVPRVHPPTHKKTAAVSSVPGTRVHSAHKSKCVNANRPPKPPRTGLALTYKDFGDKSLILLGKELEEYLEQKNILQAPMLVSNDDGLNRKFSLIGRISPGVFFAHEFLHGLHEHGLWSGDPDAGINAQTNSAYRRGLEHEQQLDWFMRQEHKPKLATNYDLFRHRVGQASRWLNENSR